MLVDTLMPAFARELEKRADVGATLRQFVASPARRALQRGVGSGLGLGALGGAALGGARGAVGGFQDARQQGVGIGQAALSGVGYGLQGAAGGAAKGALVGGALGGMAGHLNPSGVMKATDQLAGREGAVGAMSRFGERQLHGFVGGPGRELERVRGGSYLAKRELSHALTDLKVSPREVAKKQQWVQSAQKAQDMGLTSIPGFAKSLKQNGVGDTLRTGVGEAWNSSGPGMKALMVGFPAMSVGGAAMRPEQPGGPGRGEQIGRSLGAAGLAAAPLTFGASMAAGTALERAGGLAGRGVDRLRGRHALQNPSLLNAVEAEGAPNVGGGT